MSELTAQQTQLITLLASGSSIIAATKQLQISESTAHRWLHLPHVAHAYKDATDGIYRQVHSKLKKQSVGVLEKYITFDCEPTVESQLLAAELVLEQASAIDRVASLTLRLTELEQRIKQGNMANE